MGTKLGAGAAVLADDGDFAFFVEIDSADDARIHAFPAADALDGKHFDPSARTFFQRPGGTSLVTCGFPRAGKAHHGHKAALHAAFGLDLYGAFGDGMALVVDSCASEHAGEAPDALFHSVGLQYF
jgi:hypothetical protein